MSAETEKQIAMLIKRGIPKHDPRIQGLMRRAAADEEALKLAKQAKDKGV